MANIDNKTPDSPEDQIRQLQQENNRMQRLIKRHETQLQHLDKMASANEKTNIALYKELEVLQQQAEAQAREAQIEAALERVRARTMAMHKSEELREVIATVFKQLQALEFDIHASALVLIDENQSQVTWLAGFSKEILPESYKIPYVDHPYFTHFIEVWKKQIPYGVYVFEGDLKKSYDDYIFEKSEFKNAPKEVQAAMRSVDRMTLCGAYMRYGWIEIDTDESIFEDKSIVLQRFAKVFEQTYTRFLDLQRAEAQARQALQQASLERVRAEIASMRSTGDLQRITPLIWRELTTLGVPFFRCGVFIIEEATDQAHVYLSTSSGEAVAALHLKFDSAPVIAASVQHWRQQQVYREEWNREQFSAWAQSLLEQKQIDSPQKYQAGGEAPEKLVLHFVPFTQGMLYIGSSAALSDDEIALSQAIAKAFGMAYARYEDFQKLEAAKAQVEAALENLKKTQQQLVTQEKLASLGQLTAGIAHEIKNPLNFVNNFAALSIDLAKELREEIAKIEEGGLKIEDRGSRIVDRESLAGIKEILETLEQNAEKINHHGKRADGIVKSMMQHARGSSGQRELADINHLLDDAVNLTYHGLRANDPSFNVTIEKEYDSSIGKLEVVPQDLSRVFLNVINNACYAAHQKARGREQGANGNEPINPTLSVSTKNLGTQIEIRIRDNGNGIPNDIREKIFNPFFTTKPTGQGTGLGLSISYDIIVQQHRGEIRVETEEGKFTEFVIRLQRV